ncbi:MAG: hypothetical protein R3B06_04485 [Kofleriaceae bacterium]
MAAPKVPFSAVNLFGAALAELRRYDELCQHCASFGAAPLTDLALWAAERAPTRALRPNELVIASAAACMHESEFLGVAFGAQTMVCVPASDWASALRLCRANHPQPTEVWIVRRAYPREFLRSAFTPPPGIGA